MDRGKGDSEGVKEQGEKNNNNKQKQKGWGRGVFPEVRETREERIPKRRKLLQCQI